VIIEIFSLFCVGYVAGMSMLSGVIMAFIKTDGIRRWSKFGYYLWVVLACGNIFCATFGVLFIFIYSVAGSGGFNRSDFWIRSVGFCFGLAIGFVLTIVTSSVIDRVMRQVK
jgi:hypothetical protein